MKRTTRPFALTLLLAAPACVSPDLDRPPPPELPGPILHVLHVSVDGLRPDAIDALGPDRAPSFFRLRAEGATTDNARTDPKLAATLPDHACQFTSRPVFGSEGHGWALNDELDDRITLHLVKATYVPSVFDVVHDSGFSTGFYASKRKFAVFTRSWGEFGAPDPTSVDDGTDKLDLEHIDGDMQALVERFLADYAAAPPTYTFLHLREPDSTGHSEGWDLRPDRAYLGAVEDIDRILGRILDVIDSSPRRASLAVRSAISPALVRSEPPGISSEDCRTAAATVSKLSP